MAGDPRSVAELRVLLVSPSIDVLDGVSVTLLRLARHLKREGAAVLILTTRPFDLKGSTIAGLEDIDVAYAPGIRLSMHGHYDGYRVGAFLSRALKDAVRAFRPSVVHTSAPDLLGASAARFARSLGVPLVMTHHSNFIDYFPFYGLAFIMGLMRFYCAWVYGFADVVYAPTAHTRDKLAREGLARRDRVAVWGRGVDVELFAPARRSGQFRQRHGASADELVVLWVGRLVREKRPDLFLRVVQRLRAAGVACRGVVIGAGPEAAIFEGQPGISRAGVLRGEDLATAYASGDLLLFPSSVETFGNVTLEALASGCPVVAERRSAGHLVRAGVNGELVAADDEDGFFAAARRIAADSAYRARLGAAARASVLHFEVAKVNAAMADNYLRLAGEGRRAAPDSLALRRAGPARALGEVLWGFFYVAFFGFMYVVNPALVAAGIVR